MSQRNSYFDPFARYNEHDSPLVSYGSPVVYHHLTSARAPVSISQTLRYVGAEDLSPDASEVKTIKAELPHTPERLATRVIAQASKDLDIAGQGVIVLRTRIGTDETAELRIHVQTGNPAMPTLCLVLTPRSYKLVYASITDSILPISNEVPLPVDVIKGDEACYLVPDEETTYWLSIDRDNGILRYGIGYTNVPHILLQAVLKIEVSGVMAWTDPKKYSWLSDLKHAQVIKGGVDQSDILITTYPLPIVDDPSPYVITGEKITLSDLENGIFTVPGNLPEACQKLYDNIAGPNISLDEEDFDFPSAIERSVNTPGLLGYTILAGKAGEFGKNDFNGTYLRITLGRSQGNSPGAPYVLEIWPAGHYSPIHDHGDSHAVIKVLHGTIHCSYYDSLPRPTQQGGDAIFEKGAITWIGPQNYQVHKLHNRSMNGTVCCTIQCYQYDKSDKKHDEFFDYIGPNGPKHAQKFTPNSDMAYNEFRRKIKAEWDARDTETTDITS